MCSDQCPSDTCPTTLQLDRCTQNQSFVHNCPIIIGKCLLKCWLGVRHCVRDNCISCVRMVWHCIWIRACQTCGKNRTWHMWSCRLLNKRILPPILRHMWWAIIWIRLDICITLTRHHTWCFPFVVQQLTMTMNPFPRTIEVQVKAVDTILRCFCMNSVLSHLNDWWAKGKENMFYQYDKWLQHMLTCAFDHAYFSVKLHCWHLLNSWRQCCRIHCATSDNRWWMMSWHVPCQQDQESPPSTCQSSQHCHWCDALGSNLASWQMKHTKARQKHLNWVLGQNAFFKVHHWHSQLQMPIEAMATQTQTIL